MTSKKKILYIITKANWGGAQKYVFDLATKLKDLEVTVAYRKLFGELNKKLKQANIRTIEINNLERDVNIFNEFKVIKSLWKIFREEKPDIIHLNSSKIGGLGALVGRLAGIKKIIFTAHGWAFNESRPFWQTWLIKFLSWLTIILANQTIVLSRKEHSQVIHWPFITKNKLQLIYSGIKPIYFLNRDEAQEYFGDKIKNKDLVVGTISELHKNKGLKYAIKGFREVCKNNNNLKFIIIGEGEDRKYLEKKIKKYGLENKVFLAGHIEDANKYLKAFDVFLLSSIKEGLPFVLLEAGLAKLPVIATEVGGIPEIIENKMSGILIEKKEDDAVETALRELLKNEEKRGKLGENLYTKVKENFSFEKMLGETERLY